MLGGGHSCLVLLQVHTHLHCIARAGGALSGLSKSVLGACRLYAAHGIAGVLCCLQSCLAELLTRLVPCPLSLHLCSATAERDFNSRFGRVVNAARYSKKGSKEGEAGTLALDALHKQVMPFILRRTKAQVLQDLPPKIVTDVLCKMSAIQQQLYEDFSASQALSDVTSALKQQQQPQGDSAAGGGMGAAEGKAAQHVFSALVYLRKLCSHPLLALDWSVPAHRDACQAVLGAGSQAAAEAALRAIEHAPKLLALQDILVQCGLVAPEATGSRGMPKEADDLAEGSSDSGHRLLVFAQLKGMLDLVESCLLKPLGISSLRLDGSVDASARFGVVQRFNSDPTIQVLLLTTHVGGLGLNLTSADTVVFLEHDWNPMKDLQVGAKGVCVRVCVCVRACACVCVRAAWWPIDQALWPA